MTRPQIVDGLIGATTGVVGVVLMTEASSAFVFWSGLWVLFAGAYIGFGVGDPEGPAGKVPRPKPPAG